MIKMYKAPVNILHSPLFYQYTLNIHIIKARWRVASRDINALFPRDCDTSILLTSIIDDVKSFKRPRPAFGHLLPHLLPFLCAQIYR